MTTKETSRLPEIYRLDPHGQALPEDLVPFSLEPGDRHVILRHGPRRKAVLEGEVFHWDGLHYVLISDSARALRLQSLASGPRGFPIGVHVRDAWGLFVELARAAPVRRLGQGLSVFAAWAMAVGGGRVLVPHGIAQAPAFEHSVRSLDVHRLFHLFSLLPEATDETPQAAPQPLPPLRGTAFPPPSLASSRPSKPVRARASSDGVRDDPIPARYFLEPEE